MTDDLPIAIWLAAASPETATARALATAIPGARLVSTGWTLGRAAAAGRRTTLPSLDAWLAGDGLEPAREAAAAPAGPRPVRARTLPVGAALIVCGLEPWSAAVPRVLARRPDLRVVALLEDPILCRWPEFYPAAAVAAAPGALAALAAHAALVVTSDPCDIPAAEPSGRTGRPALVLALPSRLAGTAPRAQGSRSPDGLYVVACGPLEARANTLLLLHLWRDSLARSAGLPQLVLAGERGSQIEEIAPLLDWNAALRPLVAEAPGLPPAALRRLLEGARAVLVPDIAGPPAGLMRDLLALGIPMIAADTPVARRLGVLPRLDPLDGPGWRTAIAAATGMTPAPRRDPPPLPDWPDYAARLVAAIRTLP